MTGKRVGYIRVSTVEQNETRQLDEVELDKTFVDKASGRDRERPQLEKLLDYVREGDVVYVHSLDRLGRNVDDLRALIKELTGQGVEVRIVKQGLTFRPEVAGAKDPDSTMNNLMLTMLGAFAEFELAMIRERQAEGIAKAKAAGRYKGGQPKLTDEQAAELVRRKNDGESIAALARAYGVSRQTVYRYVAEADAHD